MIEFKEIEIRNIGEPDAEINAGAVCGFGTCSGIACGASCSVASGSACGLLCQKENNL